MAIDDRQREPDFSLNAFVGPGISKWSTVKDVSSGDDLNANYARVERRTGYRQQDEQTPPSHAPKHTMPMIQRMIDSRPLTFS